MKMMRAQADSTRVTHVQPLCVAAKR